MGGFQKCKVHCYNFKSFKVTNLQSSASLGFEPLREPLNIGKLARAGVPGSNPGEAEL